MRANQLGALVCGLLCLVCIFIAVERYQANAAGVEAMNQLGGGLLGALSGGGEIQPGTPAATKYAALFAVLLAAVSIVLLAAGGKGNTRSDRETLD